MKPNRTMDSGQMAPPAKLKENFFNKTDNDYTSDESSALLGGPVAVLPGSKFVPQEPTTGKTSTFGAVFIVVNACIGAGLLNFPAAYQAAGGIAVGTSMQLGFLLFIIASLLVLAVCADVRNSNSYQDIMQSMCGTTGNIVCTICIIIYCFGTCVTFFIIIGDQLDSILALITHEDDKHGHWYTDRRFTITILAVFVILPLCLPKDISILKWPSSVGVLGTIYVAAVVVANYYLLPANAATHIVTKPTSWTDVFAAIPTICFGFQCHISAVPVYASLKKRTVSQFALVITGALIIASITYILTGIYGSLTFGDQVESDVLLSYDAGNVTVTIARAMILCNMLTSYPILHFCGRLAIETVYTTARQLSPAEAAHNETPRRIIETTSWFVLSLLLALFVSSIGSVISVIGGLAAVFILVFPGLCLVQYALTTTSEMGSRTLTWCQVGLGITFIAMGVFMFGESVTAAIIKDAMGMD